MLTKQYNVIAVMSGTSLDGIDLLYIHFWFSDRWEFKIIESDTLAYNDYWLQILSGLTQKSIKNLKQIDTEYTKYLATKIEDFILEKRIKKIDFISSHGHTALHKPEKGFTYQIGNQNILADILNTKLICDFRVDDLKLGGQGAPLVPIGDKLLFNDYTYCLNLGGFANVSTERHGKRIAFDICPANIVLNHYTRLIGFSFDAYGNIAKTGDINNKLLTNLNQLDYYSAKHPKSLGLEWVELHVYPLVDSFRLTPKDILRTFVEHISVQVSNVLRGANSKTLVTGGGAYNSFLIERIKTLTLSKIIIPSPIIVEFKEALIFGLLGVLKEQNEVNVLASVTGANKDHSSGKTLLPKN